MWIVVLGSLALALSGSPAVRPAASSAMSPASAALTGIHKIQHVIMLMQENRSFDSYFGTFPGARDSDVERCADGVFTEPGYGRVSTALRESRR